MGLFPLNRGRELYDPIRKKWVAATPEEVVRQKLVAFLIEKQKFPRESIAIEKELKQLPHLYEKRDALPDRRLDLLCFGPKLAYPLLLIECKAEPLHEKMLSQMWGYNAFIEAPFVALVNEKELMLRWEEKGNNRYLDFIPTYQELVVLYSDQRINS